MLGTTLEKKSISFFILLFLFWQTCVAGFFLFSVKPASATVVTNDTTGNYTDDFADGTGLSSTSNAAVDVASGTVKLTNGSSGFTAPFNTSGYVIINKIVPVSVAKWGTVTITPTTPTGTTAGVQVIDEEGTLFSDSLVPGNSAGITTSSFSISDLSVTRTSTPNSNSSNAKFGRIAFKILLTTSDTSVTPSVNSFAFSWTVSQGDLSASPIASTAWAAPRGNNQATARGTYNSSGMYPALRWKKTIGIDSGGPFVRGVGDTVYYKTSGGIVTWPTVNDGTLTSINKNTGATQWSRVFSGNAFTNTDFTLSANGTIYHSDQFHDMFMAFDGTDGSLKWTYQFTSGHSNTEASIGSDGTIYTIRTDDSTFVNVYAFNPDGSVKWIKTVVPNGSKFSGGPISIGSDGTVYFVTQTYDNSFNNTNNGLLYALNPTDGSTNFTYATGDSSLYPVIDSSGVIYVANTSLASLPKSITAVNSNGTLKWVYSLGTTTQSWSSLALRLDGVLLAERVTSTYPTTGGLVEAINTSDGTLAWSKPFSDNNGIFTHVFMTNASNGFYRSSVLIPASASFSFFDSSGNNKWNIVRDGGIGSNTIIYQYAMEDEDGNLYINANHAGIEDVIVNTVPWTLQASTSTVAPIHGDAILFSVTTSMLQTNPLTGDSNQMQAVMDNGTKVPLTYSSTNSSGNTVWSSAYYTIPGSMAYGRHAYTVEANAAGLQTDVPVNFASPATNSSNTGLTTTGEFSVQASGSGLPSGAYELPKIPIGGFAIVVNHGEGVAADRKVTLHFNAGADVKKIALSMSSDFVGASQEPYTESKLWDVCSIYSGAVVKPLCPDGNYTIYAKFYTAWGQTSPVVSKDIILKTVVDKVHNKKVASATIHAPAQYGEFTRDLKYGSSNQQVMWLQNVLKNLGYFPVLVKSSGNFGAITRQSLKKFQCARKIACTGAGLKSEYGQVGAKTRDILNQVVQ